MLKLQRFCTNFSSTMPAWMSYFFNCYLASQIIHFLRQPLYDGYVVAWALAALLAWGLLRPRQSVAPFFLANGLILVLHGISYPNLANHAALAMFAAMLALILSLGMAVRSKPFAWDSFVNGLRGLVIVLYFYVGFHKINTHFLDPETSCATWYHEQFFRVVFGSDILLPEWALLISPWAVIIFELIAAALLFFPRTWLIGLVFAFPIHFYVSFGGFTDFSSFAHSLMLLFLPIGFWQKISEMKPGFNLFHFGYRAYHVIVFVFLIVTVWQLFPTANEENANMVFQQLMVQNPNLSPQEILPLLEQSLQEKTILESNFSYENRLWGFLYNAGVVALLIGVFSVFVATPRLMFSGQGSDWRWKPSHLVFPALILLWGFFPYLGVSNRLSLTMFSNLETSSLHQNHLLINTDVTRVTSWDNDLVLVEQIGTVPQGMFRTLKSGRIVPMMQLKNYIGEAKRAGLDTLPAILIIEGERVVYDDLLTSPLAKEDRSSFAQRTIFRDKDPHNLYQCEW